jgi:magnesium-transporting ATPase (P-type)
VPSVELVPGDVLELSEGDAVGADARLTSAASLRVQEAALTGESEAVLKDVATLGASVPLGERVNMVFKGTAVAEGHGRAVVVATGMSTEMGSIASLLEATREDPTPLQVSTRSAGSRTWSRCSSWACLSRSPLCPRAYPRSSRWCSRWACSAWPRATRS